MNRWEEVSAKRNSFYIPPEVFHSPRHHFYARTVVETERFQVLAFIFSEQWEYLTLRFWQLEHDFLPSDFNLLDDTSGSIIQDYNEIVHMIELLRFHGNQLNDTTSESIFHPVTPDQYAELQIMPEVMQDRDSALYRLVGEPIEVEIDKNRFIYLHKNDGMLGSVGFLSDITLYIKIIYLPKKVKYPPEFRKYWNWSQGGLHLTKRNAEEFCLLLEKHLGV